LKRESDRSINGFHCSLQCVTAFERSSASKQFSWPFLSILKPSSNTPLSTLALAKIIDQTDLPKGAVSIIPCSRETGNTVNYIVENAKILIGKNMYNVVRVMVSVMVVIENVYLCLFYFGNYSKIKQIKHRMKISSCVSIDAQEVLS
jgi:hypothetical protein